MKAITVNEAIAMITGKDVVLWTGVAHKGEQIVFDANEILHMNSWKERITDSEPEYIVTELIDSQGNRLRFSEDA